MPDFVYTVTVSCETSDEAERVIGERLGFDEDYGFAYVLDFEHARKDGEDTRGSLRMEPARLRSGAGLMATFDVMNEDDQSAVREMSDAARLAMGDAGTNPANDDRAAVFDEACAVYLAASRT